MRVTTAMLVIVAASAAVGAAGAADLGPAIDLADLGTPGSIWSQPETGLPLTEVADVRGLPSRRFYVSGIVGASFASLATGGGPNSDPGWNPAAFSGTVNDTLFTAGGAAGIAFTRPSGLLRVEFEGRGRTVQDGTEIITVTPRFAAAPFTLPNRL